MIHNATSSVAVLYVYIISHVLLHYYLNYSNIIDKCYETSKVKSFDSLILYDINVKLFRIRSLLSD